MTLNSLLLKALSASEKAAVEIMKVYKTDNFGVELKSDESPLTKADLAAHHTVVKELEDTEIPILSEEGGKIAVETRQKWKRLWVIDPLDGTKEFIKKNGEFTVNIALVEDGVPILGVVYIPVQKSVYFGSHELGSFFTNRLDISSLERLLEVSQKLPIHQPEVYTVVGSRSHMNEETQDYIARLEQEKGKINIVTKGSSLKLCMVAEGLANEYPRFGPTMEWDTAAGHAVALYSGAKVFRIDNNQELRYNKADLLNPYFKVIRN